VGREAPTQLGVVGSVKTGRSFERQIWCPSRDRTSRMSLRYVLLICTGRVPLSRRYGTDRADLWAETVSLVVCVIITTLQRGAQRAWGVQVSLLLWWLPWKHCAQLSNDVNEEVSHNDYGKPAGARNISVPSLQSSWLGGSRRWALWRSCLLLWAWIRRKHCTSSLMQMTLNKNFSRDCGTELRRYESNFRNSIYQIKDVAVVL